eukprot:Skav212585  [mRNA]  locus=scaffold125:464842:466770:- [translate_table: standard]
MSLERQKGATDPPEAPAPASPEPPPEPPVVEVAFQVASLVNTKEVAVGDMVTFDLGFDKKKNRPEAVNIHKATESQLQSRSF